VMALVIRTVTGLAVKPHDIGCTAAATRHGVGVWEDALYLLTTIPEELEAAKLAGWCWCARLCAVHRVPSCWAGLREAVTSPGPFFIYKYLLTLLLTCQGYTANIIDAM